MPCQIGLSISQSIESMASAIHSPTIAPSSPVHHTATSDALVLDVSALSKSTNSKGSSGPSSPDNSRPGSPSAETRVRSKMPLERESLETALQTVAFSLRQSKMRHPGAHIADDDPQREAMLKKYALEE